MTAVLYTQHFVQFFDNSGNPLSNGKLYAYSAGTTTPKATYTTEEATVENAHPIVLDSAGRATVFIQGSYRFDLFDSNDVLIKSTDDVTSFTTLNEAGDPFFQSFSGTGAQTVFTLSESLGSDSKDIMVFVDAGGSEGYEIQNPSAYTLSGTSLTFSVAPASGTNNIYVFAPTKLLGAASASAAAAAASEAAAAAAQTAAEAAQTATEAVEDRLVGITSASSVAIGTGSKSFTVASGLGFTAGQFVLIDSDADGSNYMWGQVTSYASTTLQVNVTATGGSGTYSDWTITISGVQGVRGETGTVSSAGGVVFEEGSAPSTSAGQGALYAKDIDGQPELFYREESDGDEVQITSGGSVTGGGILGENLISGKYYPGLGYSQSSSTYTLTANNLEIFPFILCHKEGVFDAVVVEVTTADAGSSIRLGIYELENGVPATLVVDAGEVSSASTGVKVAAFTPQTLNSSKAYGLAVITNGTPTIRQKSGSGSSGLFQLTGLSGTTGSVSIIGWDRAFTYGALPDPAATTGTLNNLTSGVFLRAD